MSCRRREEAGDESRKPSLHRIHTKTQHISCDREISPKSICQKHSLRPAFKVAFLRAERLGLYLSRCQSCISVLFNKWQPSLSHLYNDLKIQKLSHPIALYFSRVLSTTEQQLSGRDKTHCSFHLRRTSPSEHVSAPCRKAFTSAVLYPEL